MISCLGTWFSSASLTTGFAYTTGFAHYWCSSSPASFSIELAYPGTRHWWQRDEATDQFINAHETNINIQVYGKFIE